MTEVLQPLHARLSPSSAHRWMHCPGSVRLAETVETDIPGESIYATEGTLAHTIAEIEASRHFGKTSEAKHAERVLRWKDLTKPEWHGDMLRHAAEYVRLLDKLYSEYEHAVVMLEQKVDTGVPACWGTADAIIASPSTIHVVDYKYGQGVPVRAEHNPQLMLYGVGALDTFDELGDIETVCVTVHQPRLGNTSHFYLDAKEIRAWRDRVVKPAAALALRDDAYLAPSDTACRFCPVAGQCRARAEWAVKRDFGHPDLLSPDELAELLTDIPEIERWCTAVKETALHKAYNEQVELPGWKVVRSGGRRAIADPELAVAALANDGYEPERTTVRKLRPLGELERLVGRRQLAELLGELIVKNPGREALVPEDDKRPAIDAAVDAARDFGQLAEEQ